MSTDAILGPAAPLGALGPKAQVRAAIARAASASGIDFDFLLAQAKIESSLDPAAKAGTSSAAGLYQFTTGTWLTTFSKYGPGLGLGWAANAASDPSLKAKALALRFDPELSAQMAAALATENKTALTATLGRAPEPGELYLAHFLGADGATRFLNALAANSGQSAAAMMPKAAMANRAIFYRPDGGARSLSEVMGVINAKVAGAMEGGDGAKWAALSPGLPGIGLPFAALAADPADPGAAFVPGGPLASEFRSVAGALPAAPAMPAARSMADVLKGAFGLDAAGAGNAPDHVRAAYAKLSALGF